MLRICWRITSEAWRVKRGACCMGMLRESSGASRGI
jgi:hypothetical protein